jgi:cell division protein FtsB
MDNAGMQNKPRQQQHMTHVMLLLLSWFVLHTRIIHS